MSPTPTHNLNIIISQVKANWLLVIFKESMFYTIHDYGKHFIKKIFHKRVQFIAFTVIYC